jgi:Fe-S-cluster containining protein
MERSSLPTVTRDDCGACCQHVGTPPGYAIFFTQEPVSAKLIRRLVGDDTMALWESMSDEARAELADYYAGVRAGTIANRVWANLPCLWFDPVTRKCRHYEHRPPVCREFEVGGDSCLFLRERHGVAY